MGEAERRGKDAKIGRGGGRTYPWMIGKRRLKGAINTRAESTKRKRQKKEIWKEDRNRRKVKFSLESERRKEI